MRSTSLLLTTLTIIGMVVADYEKMLQQSRDLFYKELGCTSMDDAGTQYDCPNFKETIKIDKCILDGMEYDIDARLDNQDPRTFKNCYSACRCETEKDGQIPKWDCVHIECPEQFSAQSPVCSQQYEKGSCCSKGPICGDVRENFHKCEFEGKTYYEGEKMLADRDCSICICTKDFDNTTLIDNPSCQMPDCNVLLFNNGDIYNGCAPVYTENACCPIEYRCPEENDTVLSEGDSENGTCKFGNLEVGLGGEISSNDPDSVCKCTVPPMIDCLKK